MKKAKSLITIIIGKVAELVAFPIIFHILRHFSSYNQSNTSKSVLGGLWYNYNHFFRLNVFLKGLFLKSNYKLIAILYKKDNSFRLLKSYGCYKILFLRRFTYPKQRY